MKTMREYIAIDPHICHGQPHFAGTRVLRSKPVVVDYRRLVHTVLELLEAGVPTEKIIGADYFPTLTRKHVSAPLHRSSCC